MIYAKIIWDYMLMHHEIQKMDAIFLLGSNAIRTVDRAAELYHQGYSNFIICSGGNGKDSKYSKTEAEVFSEKLIELGIPKEKILLEKQATNTGENILFTEKLLKEKGLDFKSFILVQKPYMERRVYATFKKQWSNKETRFIVTSPKLSYEEFMTNDEEYKNKILEVMIGDLQRIKEYPKLGFQIEQEIPNDVLSAWQKLVDLGYVKYFLN